MEKFTNRIVLFLLFIFRLEFTFMQVVQLFHSTLDCIEISCSSDQGNMEKGHPGVGMGDSE